MGKRKSAPAISQSTAISEILLLVPDAQNLLAEYGLHCAGCAFSAEDTLAEGCHRHGFGDEEIEELLKELNAMIRKGSEKVGSLTITKKAAEALEKIAKKEGEEGKWIIVKGDQDGSFSLEFHEERPRDTSTFTHPEVPAVQLAVSPLTLRQIGGSRIDFRDGSFKLDPAAPAQPCRCKAHACHCSP